MQKFSNKKLIFFGIAEADFVSKFKINTILLTVSKVFKNQIFELKRQLK